MHERERSVERCLAREADSVGTMECYLALEDALSCACGRQRPHRWPPLRPRKRGSAPRLRPLLETVCYRASRRNAFTPFCTSRIMAAPEPNRSTPRSSLSADADVRSTRHTRVASAPFTWIGHNWWNETKA